MPAATKSQSDVVYQSGYGFPSMAQIVPESRQGCAAITHYDVSEFVATRDSLRGIPTLPGRTCILKIDGCVMMSDTEHERLSNCEVTRKASGNVLIAGLGLGMILHSIMAKSDVRRVTVIERCRDVIDLVGSTLPSDDRLLIVCADVFQWKPPVGQFWDTIYFDIWPDICEENLAEMTKLHRKFRRRLRVNGWMDSWCRRELRRRR